MESSDVDEAVRLLSRESPSIEVLNSRILSASLKLRKVQTMFQLWNSNRRFALTGRRDFSKLDVAKADLNQGGGHFPARFFRLSGSATNTTNVGGEGKGEHESIH